jgi:hypothetical protein
LKILPIFFAPVSSVLRIFGHPSAPPREKRSAMQVEAINLRDAAAGYREAARDAAAARGAEASNLRRDQRVEDARESDRSRPRPRDREPDPGRLVDVMA